MVSVLVSGSLFAKESKEVVSSLGLMNHRFNGSRLHLARQYWPVGLLEQNRRLPGAGTWRSPVIAAGLTTGTQPHRVRAEVAGDLSGLAVGGVAGAASGLGVFVLVAKSAIKSGADLPKHGVPNIMGIIGPMYGLALGAITLVVVGTAAFFTTRHYVKKAMLG